MKKYEFRAGNARSDAFMGLSYPAAMMLPVIGMQLALYYFKLKAFFKAYPLFLILMLLLVFYLVSLLLKKLQGRLIKNYIAELDEKSIRLWMNGNEALSDEITFCNIKAANERLINIVIGTRHNKISFRARPKKFKSLTGTWQWNCFGTSDSSDMESLLLMAGDINSALAQEGRA